MKKERFTSVYVLFTVLCMFCHIFVFQLCVHICYQYIDSEILSSLFCFLSVVILYKILNVY